MSTSFPNAVDTFPTAADLADDTLATKPHSTLHGNLGDAIIAVEQNALVIAPATSARNVIQGSADATELTLKAFAGQTAPTEIINSDAAQTDVRKVLWPSSADMETVEMVNADTAYWALSSPTGTSQTAIGATDGSGFPETSLELIVAGIHFVTMRGYADTNPPDSQSLFRLTAQSGQVLRLVEILDFGANPLVTISATGQIISNAHAAPADADLNNSDFALWLDDTPGATTLRVKAKDSGGTVRTATVPLT